MSSDIRIQFIEKGSAENPFAPRRWGFVPRVGDTVMMPETLRVYRVLAVQWTCQQSKNGACDEDDPVVNIHIAE